MQLQWHPPTPVRNLAGAGLGRVSEKLQDFSYAGAKIKYNPNFVASII